MKLHAEDKKLFEGELKRLSLQLQRLKGAISAKKEELEAMEKEFYHIEGAKTYAESILNAQKESEDSENKAKSDNKDLTKRKVENGKSDKKS